MEFPVDQCAARNVGRVCLFLQQQIDVPYRIQTSTNLLNWADVGSGVGTGQLTNFTYSAFRHFPGPIFPHHFTLTDFSSGSRNFFGPRVL